MIFNFSLQPNLFSRVIYEKFLSDNVNLSVGTLSVKKCV